MLLHEVIYSARITVMHLQKILLVPLSILGMLATFLPWFVSPGVPATDGTVGAGWITFGIYFLVLLVLLIGNIKSRLSGFSFVCICILSILCSVYGLILTDQQTFGDINTLTQTSTSIGIGLYLLISVGFLILVIGFITKGRKLSRTTKNEVQLNITVVDEKKSSE